MIVQIYEIQNPEEAREMIGLGVDHIGSVILSARHFRDQMLKATVEQVQSAGCKSSLIPLFDDRSTIMAAIDYFRPDIIHFCDILTSPARPDERLREQLDRQAEIRRRFPGISVMRSIPIGAPGRNAAIPTLEWAALFEPVSDYFLTDTLLTVEDVYINSADQRAQPVPGFIGITGKVCDWTVARYLVQHSGIPVILAGGLGPENVRQGIKQVNPSGVDSCSLTNAVDDRGWSIRFKKDGAKVRRMVDLARAAH